MQNLCSLLSDLWKDLSYSSSTTIYGWMNFRTPTTEIVAAVLFHTELRVVGMSENPGGGNNVVGIIPPSTDG